MLSIRTWLIHDWLTGMRGGEKVLLELIRLLPNSRIATLIHVPGSTHPEIDARVARTSFLQKVPGIARNYRNFLPLFPRAIRSLKLGGDCDLVLSSSHAVAKGIRLPQTANHKSQIPNHPPHLCYCHTPMRYIWGMEDQYLSPLAPRRAALAMVQPMLRRFDRVNDSVTRFVANSHNVAERIKRLYGREADVVHPGVDEAFFAPPPVGVANAAPLPLADPYYLVVSALVPYKRIDVAVEAFIKFFNAGRSDRKLLIVGSGPEERRLRQWLTSDASSRGTPNNIQFLGHVDDATLRTLYQHCRALVFPGEEDFGLTPIEAQACGRPVIALNRGGVRETVTPETGVFFGAPTVEALAQGIDEFERRESQFQATAIRNQALAFTWTRFRQQMQNIIADVLAAVAR